MHNIAEKLFRFFRAGFCFDPFSYANIRHLSGTLMRYEQFRKSRLIYPAYLIYYTRQMNNTKFFHWVLIRMLLEMEHIHKSFGPVQVFDVRFDLQPGQRTSGRRKRGGQSTLMKILGGVYPDYEGTIRLPTAGSISIRSGSGGRGHLNHLSGTVLVGPLSIYEIFLGRMPHRFSG